MARGKTKYLVCGCCIDYTYAYNDNAKGSTYKFGDDDTVPYRKSRGKGKKCKKSNDGKHSFTVTYTGYGYRSTYSPEKKRFVYARGEVAMQKCCFCGKPGKNRIY